MASAFDTTGGSTPQTSGRTGGGRNLAEQSSRVVSEVQELGRVALESAGETATRLRERGTEALEHGRERVVQAKGAFEHVVADNPMKSVLIAAGVGIALGFVLSRRSR